MNDLEFAMAFAKESGDEIVRLRQVTGRHKKPDRTDVTDLDINTNVQFVRDVRHREGRATSVLGEERSHKGTNNRVWVIDPIDGTGEYVDDSVTDEERTTCVGISLLVDWQIVLSVVNNPFRGEIFTATSTSPTRLNGSVVRCLDQLPATGVPYDYACWNGAAYNLPALNDTFGKPLGTYSAIYQACLVASGRSAFAAFAGDTLHDVAPAALLVQQAGGIVTDFRGRKLAWRSLAPGVLYASRVAHADALSALRAL